MTEDKKSAAASARKMDRTRNLTVQALEKIDSLSLPSSPQFYELWYRYFDGDPEIKRAIDAHAGAFDEAACQSIYNRFLSANTNDNAVRTVSDKVTNSISALAAILKSASAATSDFGGALDGVSEKIGKATSIEDLTDVVADIIADTKKMVEKNQQLETHLDKSSKEVSELKEYLESVKKEATTDSLTGISNRKHFDQQLADSIAHAAEKKTPLVLLMCDIDFFKKFNDTHGHPAGDQILRLVARTLVGNVKGQDTAARYGGEEFAIILPGTPITAGLRVAEVLRHSIETKEVTNRVTHESLGAITLSIGAAELKPGEDSATLIERADTALYDAKHTGRNRVCAAK